MTEPIITQPHPAKFSNAVLDEMNAYLVKDHPGWASEPRILYDPFAGVGKCFELQRPNLNVYATELEVEWANHCRRQGMICADAFKFMRDGSGGRWKDIVGEDTGIPMGGFDYVATSPTYGNRMADHHQARDGSKRHTYRHYLGRDLSDNNSGEMQWGEEYRKFHAKAWKLCHGVMRPGGDLVNVKDHVRKGARQMVVDWHTQALHVAGFDMHSAIRVDTPGMKHGENGEVRVDGNGF